MCASSPTCASSREGITTNPEIPFAESMSDYIMRWLASRFLDADTQEELGILTPAVRARRSGQDVAPSATGDTAGPSNGGGNGKSTSAEPATPSGAAPWYHHARPAGRPTARAARGGRNAARISRRSCRRGWSAWTSARRARTARRHDAADRVALHALELRQQHRLRLSRSA